MKGKTYTKKSTQKNFLSLLGTFKYIIFLVNQY